MNHDRAPSTKKREQLSTRTIGRATAIFRTCTETYRRIKGSSGALGATDYSRIKESTPQASRGRVNSSDYICDIELSVRHVLKNFRIPFEKFQMAYLMPLDLDDAQELYVERIFKTRQPIATDFGLLDLHEIGNQADRIMRDRERRPRLETACGLDFERRGLFPKVYFGHYVGRKESLETYSPESEIQRERLEGANGESRPQSNDPAIQALIESAFKYEESQGGMTGAA